MTSGNDAALRWSLEVKEGGRVARMAVGLRITGVRQLTRVRCMTTVRAGIRPGKRWTSACC